MHFLILLIFLSILCRCHGVSVRNFVAAFSSGAAEGDVESGSTKLVISILSLSGSKVSFSQAGLCLDSESFTLADSIWWAFAMHHSKRASEFSSSDPSLKLEASLARPQWPSHITLL